MEIALRREFDYLIPEELRDQVEVGTRVKVPFGPRQVLGCVTALVEHSPHDRLRPILKVISRPALITARVLELARWIAEYYCCPLEIALRSVLPEAVRREEDGWRRQLTVWALPQHGDLPALTPRQQQVWTLIEEWRELPLRELQALAETTAATIRKLEDKGLVRIGPRISERDPYAREEILPTSPLALNAEQAAALAAILEVLGPLDPANPDGRVSVLANPLAGARQGSTESHPPEGPNGIALSREPHDPRRSTFLLHGVTGSGKTEVYLQAIAHTLRQGKGAIVLVPEISLTPQTVERFKARFCSGPLRTLVAVLHSHLSAGERHDEWHKIREGRARIVIGARSAVFAPIEPLGLIVVDEEHEPSYKQEEAPRYHARDVAVVRGQREHAVVVLGSATPSLESYHNARRAKYRLLELPFRADDKQMPVVRVVDLRDEMRAEKGVPIFSRRLRDAIALRLERAEQAMLFLNRRGYSTSLQCPKCGYVAECPNCSVALTYHRADQRLLCHICGHATPAPRVCPQAACGNPAIRYAGLGTEKVEDTLVKLFPKARISRMDSDTLKRKEDYRRILGDFRTGKIDILVGTQMIAKGLHFPNVTLVGIVYADQGLHQPDFRAGERTFQLLTQVSGRAGRGDVEGEVVVQAFTPFHPAIQFARRHDFVGYYDQELELREPLLYPPVSRIALLTLKGRNEDKVRFTADHLKRETERACAGITPLVQAGPAPAPLLRAETFYRYQIMVRTPHMRRLSARLAELLARWSPPEEVSLTVDIDPVNLF